MNHWKVPLLKKKQKAEEKLQRDVERAKAIDRDQKELLVVHEPDMGVTLPVHPEHMYAIIRLKGIQHKVMKDDRVRIEKLGDEVQIGDQICIDDVLLIGTRDYTAIGRPTVTKARVYATFEEESRAEKVLIFKKRRRKGYQKSQGHRQTVNVLRIDKIDHAISGKDFAN